MKIAKLAAIALFAMVSLSFAQDFDNINLLNVQSQTAAPQAASAQGAPSPYYGSNVWWQPRDPYQDYYRQAYEHRYQNVRRQLRSVASQYGWGSQYAAYYNQQAQYGEDLYVRFLRYRDQYSQAALNSWISQWEQQLSYGQDGNNNGGWYNNNGYYSCTCAYDRYSCSSHPYYNNNNGGWGNGGGYSQACTCHYDRYSCTQHRSYYPNQTSYGYPQYGYNENYVNGLQIGNGIGHIVTGGRRHNDFETVGGVLSTAGGIINVISNARRW